MKFEQKKWTEDIANADMILIGLGKEFSSKHPNYSAACLNLYEEVRDKNYFIVDLNIDDGILQFPFDKERIVTPCGSYYKMQCEDMCTNEIYPVDEQLKEEIRKTLAVQNDVDPSILPTCPNCGKSFTFNICKVEKYNEEGYLQLWDLYTKWIKSTMNRNLCILELGVGFEFPTVIRWPFEKLTLYNQKATLYRIHSSLAQVSEEINERAISCKENPILFLNRKLSK